MKKLLTIFILLSFFNQSFSYQELINEKVNWKNLNYIKVILDWNHSIITSVSEKWESLESLVNKVSWISWVNWAYFCPKDYKECSWINYSQVMRIFKWEVYSKYGDDLWYTWMFWFDYSWNSTFILNNKYDLEWIKREFNNDNFGKVEYWIANFPVLILNWENVIKESLDVLDNKQKTKWIKSFICSESDNKTIKMWNVSDVNFEELTWILKDSLNCYNAINLDSWASLWMIYDNKIIKKPWRDIMDAFVVVETKKEVFSKKFIQELHKKIDEITKNNPETITMLGTKINKYKLKIKNKQSKKYKLLEEIEVYLKTK